MCNTAIRVAITEKPSNRFKLIELAYPHLKEYGMHTNYILTACKVAHAVCTNKNAKRVPYIKKAFLELGNQTYQLNHLLLRIPATPRHYIFLVLQGSDYHLSLLNNPSHRLGSVIITGSSVNIAVTKEVEMTEPGGFIGVDINERNTTVSTTEGYSHRHEEPSDVVEIKQRYQAITTRISRATSKDNRMRQMLLAKYGKRERDRTIQRIHRMTKKIVDYALENKLGIKMEKLTGIGKLYRRGNGQGPAFRGRMNKWVFGETQRQLNYKASWDGVQCWLVNPRGTSSNCLCGSRVAQRVDRKVYCPKCERTWDRDDLASKRIMACAVPQARPFT